jgi:hypothetical protein
MIYVIMPDRIGGNMKKIIIVGVLVIIAAAVVWAIIYLTSNLNSIVAKAIEHHGSEVMDTDVSVSGVDISLREGRGSITGLNIANPEGFNTGDAFSLGDVTVDIDLGSVRQDPVVIEEVRVIAPMIYAEVTKAGESNIDALRKRIQAHTGGSGESAGGDQKKIRIKKFVFEKGRIEVDATALGLEKRTVELPEFRLDDVGGVNGAPPDQIAKLVFGDVAKRVGTRIAGSEINRLIEDKLGGSLTDKAKGLLDKLTD